MKHRIFCGEPILANELNAAVNFFGGFHEVIKHRRWQKVRRRMSLPEASSSGAQFKNIYMHYNNIDAIDIGMTNGGGHFTSCEKNKSKRQNNKTKKRVAAKKRKKASKGSKKKSRKFPSLPSDEYSTSEDSESEESEDDDGSVIKISGTNISPGLLYHTIANVCLEKDIRFAERNVDWNDVVEALNIPTTTNSEPLRALFVAHFGSNFTHEDDEDGDGDEMANLLLSMKGLQQPSSLFTLTEALLHDKEEEEEEEEHDDEDEEAEEVPEKEPAPGKDQAQECLLTAFDMVALDPQTPVHCGQNMTKAVSKRKGRLRFLCTHQPCSKHLIVAENDLDLILRLRLEYRDRKQTEVPHSWGADKLRIQEANDEHDRLYAEETSSEDEDSDCDGENENDNDNENENQYESSIGRCLSHGSTPLGDRTHRLGVQISPPTRTKMSPIKSLIRRTVSPLKLDILMVNTNVQSFDVAVEKKYTTALHDLGAHRNSKKRKVSRHSRSSARGSSGGHVDVPTNGHSSRNKRRRQQVTKS